MNKIMFLKVYGRRILAQDSFDRSNGALGTAEIGGAWTVNNGSVSIVSNKAKGGSATATTDTATLVMGQLDYEISVDITWYTGEVVSVFARCAASGFSDLMRLRYDGTDIVITKIISGSSTTLATAALSWTSGTTKRLALSCVGNTFVGYVDKVQYVNATDDNTTKTRYNVGFGAFAAAAPASLFDNFLVMGV